jgi:tellurite resistance protein TerA
MGLVQALGRRVRRLSQPAFIQLERRRSHRRRPQGARRLRINGARWNEHSRVAIFANIYEGAPNWSATDGVVP